MTSIFAHAVLLALLVAPIAAHADAPATPSKGADAPVAAPSVSTPAITPDRPGFTNGSDTVVPGRTQLEMGIAQTYFPSGAGGGNATDYPETLVRHGLTPRLELRAAMPNYSHQDGTPSGCGDASLGVKYKFFQSRDGNTKAALTPRSPSRLGAPSTARGNMTHRSPSPPKQRAARAGEFRPTSPSPNPPKTESATRRRRPASPPPTSSPLPSRPTASFTTTSQSAAARRRSPTAASRTRRTPICNTT